MALFLLLKQRFQLNLFKVDLLDVFPILGLMTVHGLLQSVKAIFEIIMIVVPFTDIIFNMSFNLLLKLPLLFIHSFPASI
jgi:hypothetical protein